MTRSSIAMRMATVTEGVRVSTSPRGTDLLHRPQRADMCYLQGKEKQLFVLLRECCLWTTKWELNLQGANEHMCCQGKLWKQPLSWFETASSKTGEKMEISVCTFWSNRENDVLGRSSCGAKGWNNHGITEWLELEETSKPAQMPAPAIGRVATYQIRLPLPNAGEKRPPIHTRESTCVWNRALKVASCTVMSGRGGRDSRGGKENTQSNFPTDVLILWGAPPTALLSKLSLWVYEL